MVAEGFNAQAGSKITHAPYKGTGAAPIDPVARRFVLVQGRLQDRLTAQSLGSRTWPLKLA